MPDATPRADSAPLLTLYGIPNCDQVRQSRTWLEEHKVAYRFHDFRRDGLTHEKIADWLRLIELNTLLNRQSTTWRKIPEDLRPTDVGGAITLMLAQPSVIKRPILERTGHSNGSEAERIHVGRLDSQFALQEFLA